MNAVQGGDEALRIDELLTQLIARVKNTNLHSGHATGAIELEQLEISLRAAAGIIDLRGTELTAAVERVSALRARLPFLADHWPSERARLESKFRDHVSDGLLDWLTTWSKAAGEWRMDALRRLSGEDLDPPSAAAVATDRLRGAQRALDAHNFLAARPTLQALAEGAALDGKMLVETSARAALHLLLARMELATSSGGLSVDPVAAAIGHAADLVGEIPPIVAARAGAARLQGNAEEFARLAGEARSFVAVDLAALVEQIHLHGDTDPEALEQALAEGVEPLVERDDIESEVMRLLQPLPPRLWIEVAATALRLNSFSAADYALEVDTRSWSERERAELSQLRVRRLRQGGGASDEIADELIEAARHLMWSDPPDVEAAGHLYEEALTCRPDDPNALVEVAEAARIAAFGKPIDVVRPQLEQALARIRAARQLGSVYGWSYLTESEILLRLYEGATSGGAEYLWRAILASLRAVSVDPNSAEPWRTLAHLLGELSLYDGQATAALHAAELDPDDYFAETEAISALANIGRLSESMDMLQGFQGNLPWRHAMQGYLLARLGDIEDAFEAYQRYVVDPEIGSSWWAWRDAIEVAHSLGNADWARETTSAVWKLTHEWEMELGARELASYAALELGYPKESSKLATAVLRANRSRSTAKELLGAAQLVQGHTAVGIYWLRRAILDETTASGLDDYERSHWQAIERWASRDQVEIPSFSVLSPAIEDRRKLLRGGQDFWSDLTARTEPLPAELVRLIPPWTQAVLDYAQGNFAAAQEKLGVALLPGEPQEVEFLRLQIRTDLTPPQNAGNDTQAQDLPSPSIASDDQFRGGQSIVSLQLSPSWLARLDNRTAEQELIARYFLELDSSPPERAPVIRVEIRQELGPDGFRILSDHDVISEGFVRPDYVYAFRPSLAVLPKSLTREWPSSDLLPDLVTLIGDLGGPLEDGVGLLTMQPIDVVLRKLAIVASGAVQQGGEEVP